MIPIALWLSRAPERERFGRARAPGRSAGDRGAGVESLDQHAQPGTALARHGTPLIERDSRVKRGSAMMCRCNQDQLVSLHSRVSRPR
jgi:hypothetical protein